MAIIAQNPDTIIMLGYIRDIYLSIYKKKEDNKKQGKYFNIEIFFSALEFFNLHVDEVEKLFPVHSITKIVNQ